MMLAFYFTPYDLLLIPGVVIALWARMRLQSTYAEYSQIGSQRGISGAEAAREILDRNGLHGVAIEEVAGQLTDHYAPMERKVYLSSENFQSTSLAAIGVAAHEVGHALQHKDAYGPLGLRMALVPVTGIASWASTVIFFAGLLLTSLRAWVGFGSLLLWAGIGLFSLVVLFQIITLPVEYDASRRAKLQLQKLGLVTPDENAGVNQVLSAAALTYVAAMASAVLGLLRLILIARDRDDRR
jgi:uncharacterized protein